MWYFITNNSYFVIIGCRVICNTLYYIPFFELYDYCICGKIGNDIMTLVTYMSHSLLFDYPYHNLEWVNVFKANLSNRWTHICSSINIGIDFGGGGVIIFIFMFIFEAGSQNMQRVPYQQYILGEGIDLSPHYTPLHSCA